jgi:hypothetical protein
MINTLLGNSKDLIFKKENMNYIENFKDYFVKFRLIIKRNNIIIHLGI